MGASAESAKYKISNEELAADSLQYYFAPSALQS
jgi:hypothetical protein